MNEVVNKLNHTDMQINMLKSNAESLQKDFSAVIKIQDMINSDDNSNIVGILKNQQKYQIWEIVEYLLLFPNQLLLLWWFYFFQELF